MSKRRNSEEASLVCPYASCGYSIKSVQDGRCCDRRRVLRRVLRPDFRTLSLDPVTPVVEPPVAVPITSYEKVGLRYNFNR